MVSQKLELLQNLQEIDSKLDEIRTIRGALPEEVNDLEDEIAGYQTRIDKFNRDIEEQDQEINKNKNGQVDAQKLISKYGEQQMNVRNNREYDALTKEIELQSLEIQICEKRIKEAEQRIVEKKAEIAETQVLLDERKKDLTSKQAELEFIISENRAEEQTLREEREKASQLIEERLLKSYNKIRSNARNGLAVVTVQRNACGGCFNIVPPQRQAEVRERKKIIVCEHCGRILAGVEEAIAGEEEKKSKKVRK
jgi:predicted  nucleic acid-binding Zn-ribbon protein